MYEITLDICTNSMFNYIVIYDIMNIVIVYEKIRIKPMIKVKGVSEHKKNAVSIYTKKFSNSKG